MSTAYDDVSAAAPFGALDAHLLVPRGEFSLDVELSAEPGEVLAVLGPNGAGKSTLLMALAGLIAPDEGRVRLGGRMLTGRGILVPPERRRIGLMGQDPLLFPHLTAVENIAFGPRSQRTPRTRARAEAVAWLDRLGLAEFATRKPAEISGGQRQRVALGRALAARPELLLLDEPLGALDARTAPEVRHVLRTHIRAAGITTILVTHDVLDAAMLADRIIVLDRGRIVETGPVAEVLAAPRSDFTAALAGVNLAAGVVESAAGPGEVAAMAMGPVAISGIAADALRPGDAAAAVFEPSAVAVYLHPVGAGSPRNTWRATVVAIEPGATAIRVRARLGPQLADAAVDAAAAGTATADPDPAGSGTAERASARNIVIPETGAAAGTLGAPSPPIIAADLTAASVAELRLSPGMVVHLAVKATEVRIHAR